MDLGRENDQWKTTYMPINNLLTKLNYIIKY